VIACWVHTNEDQTALQFKIPDESDVAGGGQTGRWDGRWEIRRHDNEMVDEIGR